MLPQYPRAQGMHASTRGNSIAGLLTLWFSFMSLLCINGESSFVLKKKVRAVHNKPDKVKSYLDQGIANSRYH